MLGKGLESLIPKKNDGDKTSLNSDDSVNIADIKNSLSNSSSNAPKEAETSPMTPPSKTLSITEPPTSSTAKIFPQKDDRSFSKPKPQSKDAIFHIETDKIKPNPHQPRRDFDEESLKELANSIREHGILQPLVVSKIEKETDFGSDVEYQLIAGERRWRAAKLIGLERVPAIIKNVAKDAERLEMAIVENLQRSNLNPIETARAYAKLQDVFGLTQQEIATRLGKSRETIANTLRLLKLPSEIQEALSKNQINESQARLLLTINDAIKQQNIFKEIIGNNLSVRELRSRLRAEKQSAATNKQQTTLNPEIINLEEKLTEIFGAKVKIKQKEKGGEIIIEFYSPEEIEGIIQKIIPNSPHPDQKNY